MTDAKTSSRAKAKAVRPNDLMEVTAPHPRRRAGLTFGPAPVRLDPSDLDDAQRKAIEHDPVLNVRMISKGNS